MSDPLKAMQQQLKDLAKKQKETDARLKEMKQQSDAQIKDISGLLTDNQEALWYAQKYFQLFVIESVEQSMMYSSAISKFSNFLNLPPSTSSLNAYIDLAFTVVSTVVPALKVTGLLAKIDSAVALKFPATVLLEKTPSNYAQLGQEYFDVVSKANDIRTKTVTAVAEDPSVAALKNLPGLDAARSPIKEWAEGRHKVIKLMQRVGDGIVAEFGMRLADPKKPRTPSLLSMAKSALPMPDFPSDDHLAEIETIFLYRMIEAYCKQNVKIVDLIASNTNRSMGRTIDGLNNTQQDAIITYFGGGYPNGQRFIPIPGQFATVYMQLEKMNVPRARQIKYIQQHRR